MLGALARRISGPPPPPNAPALEQLRFIRRAFLRWAVPTAALAGGFIFGPSRILHDVPSDPEIYFNGEEPNLAVRLWTAGFDLFSPHVVVIYHYYLRKDGSRHWNDAVSRETL